MTTIDDSLCAICGEVAHAVMLPEQRPVCRDHLCPGLSCRACATRPCTGDCPICRTLSTPPFVLATRQWPDPRASQEEIDRLLSLTALGQAALAAEKQQPGAAPGELPPPQAKKRGPRFKITNENAPQFAAELNGIRLALRSQDKPDGIPEIADVLSIEPRALSDRVRKLKEFGQPWPQYPAPLKSN